MILSKSALKTFKKCLIDASKTFGIPSYKVTYVQFMYLAKGRFTQQQVWLFGGYTRLRAWAAPAPDQLKEQIEAKKIIERILKNVA